MCSSDRLWLSLVWVVFNLQEEIQEGDTGEDEWRGEICLKEKYTQGRSEADSGDEAAISNIWGCLV